jgi:hypothetical protein
VTVRAKFFITSKSEPQEGCFTVELHPVVDGSAENRDFYKWTPAGKIELSTINPEAAGTFEVGKSMYVDFTPAED